MELSRHHVFTYSTFQEICTKFALPYCILLWLDSNRLYTCHTGYKFWSYVELRFINSLKYNYIDPNRFISVHGEFLLWKRFPHYWPFVRVSPRTQELPVIQNATTLMSSLLCLKMCARPSIELCLLVKSLLYLATLLQSNCLKIIKNLYIYASFFWK